MDDGNLKDLKVLIVVDVQNCFIQGGSLGSTNMIDLYKFIQLVKNLSKKISEERYDLVVFSKDHHPINHSSLYEITDVVHGVYTYHCRNINQDCRNGKLLYMPTSGEKMIYDIIQKDLSKDKEIDYTEFYNKEKKNSENNFYNEGKKEIYRNLLNKDDNVAKIKGIIDDDVKKLKTIQSDDRKISISELIDKVSADFDILITTYTETENDFIAIKDLILNFLNNIKNKNASILGTKICGPKLSYLFYGTEIADIIKNLNASDNKYELKINNDLKNTDQINLKNSEILSKLEFYKETNKITEYITVLKGEYCNFEAYSAFNYHAKIEKEDSDSLIKELFDVYDRNLNLVSSLPVNEQMSTGLFEIILKCARENSRNTVNIDVCGLVTNICVINTVHQGIAMWNKVYKIKEENKKIKCNFTLLDNLSIPLYIDIPSKNLKYEYTSSIPQIQFLEGETIQIISKIKKQKDDLIELINAKFEIDVMGPNDLKDANLDDYKFTLQTINEDIQILPSRLSKTSGGSAKKNSNSNKEKAPKISGGSAIKNNEKPTKSKSSKKKG